MEYKIGIRTTRRAGHAPITRIVGTSFENLKELKEFKKLYQKLPEIVKTRGMQEAFYDGAKKTANAVRVSYRAYWNMRTGRVFKSIKARRGKVEYFPSALAQVGGKGARQANILEGGSDQRGKYGSIQESNFFARGIVASRQERTDAVINGIRSRLPEIINEAYQRRELGINFFRQ